MSLDPLRAMYPPIEPYETGTIDVGDGIGSTTSERVGTSGAKAAVFLHGGPGGGLAHQYEVRPLAEDRRSALSELGEPAAPATEGARQR